MNLSSCDIGNPAYKTSQGQSGEGHFIAEIFCVNQDGGDFSIMRDLEYSWKEVPDGMEVEATLYEDFSEFSCGIPEDIEEQVRLNIGEFNSTYITELTIRYK